MIVKVAPFRRAIEALDPAIRVYLVHGQDDAGARALADLMGERTGAGAERIDLDGATLKDDPARLADEAAALSLFGDRRWLRVTGGDECTAAVDALLTAPSAGNPVMMIAGALKATGALLKRVSADPAALACQLYRPDASNLHEYAISAAQRRGVRLDRGAASALVANSAGHAGLIDQEVEKIALFLDAAPDRPRPAGMDTLDAIAAALETADFGRSVNAVLGGDVAKLDAELDALGSENLYIPTVRAVAARLRLLAKMRGRVDKGERVDAVIAAQGNAIFFKERNDIAAQLRRWTSPRIAAAHRHLAAGEESMMTRSPAASTLARHALLELGRVAQRLK